MNRKAVIGVKFHQKSPELEEQKEKQKKKKRGIEHENTHCYMCLTVNQHFPLDISIDKLEKNTLSLWVSLTYERF